MIKKLFFATLLITLIATAGYLSAFEYEYQDIGTLQADSSEPISLNNRGEILLSYHYQGSQEWPRFLRDKEGVFFDLPRVVDGQEVDWNCLTNTGLVYGTSASNNQTILYRWDRLEMGAVELDRFQGERSRFSGKGVRCFANDLGQVVINTSEKLSDGNRIYRVFTWNDGWVKELKGLEDSEEATPDYFWALSINNNGIIVGLSTVSVECKNKTYNQTHAVKWVNGEVIDLHKTVPKMGYTSAVDINDRDEILVGYLIDGWEEEPFGGLYLVKPDGESSWAFGADRMNNSCFYNDRQVFDKKGEEVFNYDDINKIMINDHDSEWLTLGYILQVNDHGEIIMIADTIYGENHALFLYPVSDEVPIS